LVVDEGSGTIQLLDARAQRVHAAGTEERPRVDVAKRHRGTFDDGGAQGASQLLELVELDLGLLAPRPAVEGAGDEDTVEGGGDAGVGAARRLRCTCHG